MPFSKHAYSLHMIFSPDGWEQAKALIEDTDRIVFLQDACYLLESELASPSELLYARAIDVKARAIKAPDAIELLDDELWVKLTEQSTNVLSW